MLVTASLDAAAIPYMITGSLALSHYAQPRMTRDIDLVVALDDTNVESFVEALHDEFDCDIDRIRAAIERRGMFNVIHPVRIVKVDFVVRKDAPYRQEEFARRRPVVVGGQSMWMVSPEDLLLSKLAWARDSRSAVQLADVRNLIEATPIDWRYVEHWASVLDVTELVGEARRG